ncbi:DUF6336 family protein [Streptomyces koelreuteriae]|uniref:DUF6336 family protein n=1 Tax=Streptomyces koelreuteriae TaxID=2838015 RepID=UPI003EB80C2A
MALDQDGVMLPRLRPTEVARRGVTFGLLSVIPLAVAAFSITDDSAREDLLSVSGALACLLGAMFLVIGAGFWWASAADVRRLRDWNTITSQAASVTLVGPVFLRSGLFLLVLGAAALGLNLVVAD